MRASLDAGRTRGAAINAGGLVGRAAGIAEVLAGQSRLAFAMAFGAPVGQSSQFGSQRRAGGPGAACIQGEALGIAARKPCAANSPTLGAPLRRTRAGSPRLAPSSPAAGGRCRWRPRRVLGTGRSDVIHILKTQHELVRNTGRHADVVPLNGAGSGALKPPLPSGGGAAPLSFLF